MAQIVGTAIIEILPDFTKFRAQVHHQIQTVTGEMSKDLSKFDPSKPMVKAFDEAGQKSATALTGATSKAFHTIESGAATAGEKVASEMTKAGSGAEKAMGNASTTAKRAFGDVEQSADKAATHIETDMKKAGAAAKGAASEAQSSWQNTAKTLGKGLLGAAAVREVVQFGKGAVDEFVKVAGETRSLQRVAGGTTEEMSRLRFGASMVGISAEKLSGAFKFLSKNTVKVNSDFDKGNGKLAESAAKTREQIAALQGLAKPSAAQVAHLKELQAQLVKTNSQMTAGGRAVNMLGVETRNADGSTRNLPAVLRDSAEALSKMQNGAEKNAATMKIFGRGGLELLPFLNKGAAGFDELAKKSDLFGLTMSQDQIDNVTKYKVSQRELSAAFDGMQIALGSVLLPVLTKVITFITGTIVPGFAALREMIANKVGPVIDGLSTKFAPLVDAISTVADAVVGFFKAHPEIAFGMLATVLGGALLAGLIAVVSAVASFVGPIVLAVAAVEALVAAVILAYQNFEPFRNLVDGIATAIGDVLAPAIETVQDLFAGNFSKAAEDAGKTLGKIKDVFVNLPGEIMDALSGLATVGATLMEKGRAIMADFFAGIIDSTKDIPVVGPIVKALATAFDAVMQELQGVFNIVGGLLDGNDAQVQAGVDGIIDSILKFFTDAVPNLLAGMTDLFGTVIPDALDSAVDAIKDIPILGQVGGFILDTIKGGLQVLGGLGDIIGGLLTFDPGRILTGLGGVATGIATWLVQLPKQVLGLLGDGASLLSDLITGFISQGLTAAAAAIADIPILGQIGGFLLDALKGVLNIGAGVLDIIAGIFTFDGSKILKGLGGIVSTVGNFLIGLPGRILGYIGDVGEILGSVLRTAADWIVDNAPKLFEVLKDLPSIIGDLISSAFSGIGDIIGNLFGSIFGDGGDVSKAGKKAGKSAGKKKPEKDNPVIAWLTSVWDGAVDWVTTKAGPTLSRAFGGFVSKLPGILGDIFGSIGDILGTVIGGLAGVIGSWAESLGGLIWDALKGAFNFVVDNGPGILVTLAGWLGSLVGWIVGMLGDLGGTLLGWLVDAFLWLGENALNGIGTLLGWVMEIPGLMLQGLASLAETLLTWMMDAFDWIVENGPGILAGLWDWISGIPGTILSTLGDIGSTLWGWLKAGFDWLATDGLNILVNFYSFMFSIPGKILGWLGDIGSTLWGWIKAGFDWIVTNGSDVLSKLWDWVKGIPGSMLSTLGDIGSKLWGWLKGGFDWVTDKGGDLISGMLDWFSDLPGKLLGAITSAFSSVGDFANHLYTVIARFINQHLLKPIKKVEFFGGHPFDFIPYIPEQFAEGGIITVATPAIVGEAGPEVIIPLTDAARAKELVAQSGLMDLIGAGAATTAITAAAMPTGGAATPVGALAMKMPTAGIDAAPVKAEATDAMKGVVDSAISVLQPLADWFANVGPNAAAEMALFGGTVWAATEPGLTDLIAQMTAVFDGFVVYLTGWQATVTTTIASVGPGGWAAASAGLILFQTEFEAVFTALGTFLSAWRSNVQAGLGGLPDWLGGLGQLMIGALEAPFRTFAKAIWTPFATALTTAFSQIPATSKIVIPALAFPTAHAGGVVGGSLPMTSGVLDGSEMMVKMKRGEGVIPVDTMRQMSSAEFDAIRRGDIGERDPRLDRATMDARLGFASAPAGAGTGSPSGSLTMLPASILANLKVTVDSLRAGTAAMAEQFYVPRYLGGLTGKALDASLGYVGQRVTEANNAALVGVGGGSVFPGGVPSGLAGAIAQVKEMRGKTGSFRALLDYFHLTGIAGRAISTIRPGAVVRANGRPSLHSFARAVDFAGMRPSVDSPELLAVYHAFDPIASLLQERIYSGPGGNLYGRSGITADDHHNHVHVGLANGALITRPMQALLGEAGPEVVIPLSQPMRALALANQSGLLNVLARARSSSTTAAQTSQPSTSLAMGSGAPTPGLFPGSATGNTYNIYGISMAQVIAEIQAREEASSRVNFARR